MAIYIIYGPTASGKTKLAIELAKTTESCIINMDSKQSYFFLEDLTASPSQEEKKLAPHYFFNDQAPNESVTVNQWYTKVKEFIENVYYQNYIIVGGSAFYLKYLLTSGEGSTGPCPFGDLVNILLNSFSWQSIINIFFKDPPSYRKMPHTKDKFRQFNYLKDFFFKRSTYRKISFNNKRNSHKVNVNQILPFNFKLIIIDPDKETITNNIKIRTPQLFTDKTMKEADFVQNTFHFTKTFKGIIGFQLVLSKLEKDEIIEETINQTIQYAKKQKQWIKEFKKYDPILIKEVGSTKLEDIIK